MQSRGSTLAVDWQFSECSKMPPAIASLPRDSSSSKLSGPASAFCLQSLLHNSWLRSIATFSSVTRFFKSVKVTQTALPMGGLLTPQSLQRRPYLQSLGCASQHPLPLEMPPALKPLIAGVGRQQTGTQPASPVRLRSALCHPGQSPRAPAAFTHSFQPLTRQNQSAGDSNATRAHLHWQAGYFWLI